jgi:hypothetical protein
MHRSQRAGEFSTREQPEAYVLNIPVCARSSVQGPCSSPSTAIKASVKPAAKTRLQDPQARSVVVVVLARARGLVVLSFKSGPRPVSVHGSCGGRAGQVPVDGGGNCGGGSIIKSISKRSQETSFKLRKSLKTSFKLRKPVRG